MGNSKYHRCAVCDRTNNSDAITYPEQYYGGGYRPDPHNELQDVCNQCDDEIYDSLLLWEENEDELEDEDFVDDYEAEEHSKV